MLIKVKVLNDTDEDTKYNISPSSIPEHTEEAEVLTSAYVRELNRGLSYRMQQIASSHANDINHARNTILR